MHHGLDQSSVARQGGNGWRAPATLRAPIGGHGGEETGWHEGLFPGEGDVGVEASLGVVYGEVLDDPVFARPAVQEPTAHLAAGVERCGEHERGVGEARDVHGADGLDAVSSHMAFGRAEVGVEVAGEHVHLERAERLLLDGRDVVLVCEADHSGELVEGADIIRVWLGVIPKDISGEKVDQGEMEDSHYGGCGQQHAEQMHQVVVRIGDLYDRTAVKTFICADTGGSKHVGKDSRLCG